MEINKRVCTKGFWYIIFSSVWTTEGLGKKQKDCKCKLTTSLGKLNLNKRTKWKKGMPQEDFGTLFSHVFGLKVWEKTKRLQMQIDYKELNLNKRTKWKRKRYATGV